MQETRVQYLVWEDPTCHGATMPMSQLLKPMHPRASASQPEKPWQWETHTSQLEKCSRSNEDPAQQINKQIHLFFLNAENPRYPVLQEVTGGNSLAVQWLRHSISTAESLGLIPGQGTKIPHAVGQLSPRATTTKTQSSQKTTTNNKTQDGLED